MVLKRLRRRLWLAAACCAMAAAAEEPPAIGTRSIGDGVFTQAQAERGRMAYAEPCGRCHGHRLDGAPDDPDMFSTPPVAGPKFLRDWDGRSLATLFEYSRTTMPANNPGFLTDQEFVDILAYILFASGMPWGEQELEPDRDRLAAIVVATESR